MAGVEGIEIEEGVAFGRGNDRDLLCDIYTPRSGANDTGVLMFYGGGWSRGDRGSMREPALALAAQGFVTVAPEYRLTTESPWPAQLHDVKAAIRWMRASAGRLGIDPVKVTIEGHSAGGQLGLVAAGTPNVAELEGDGGNAGVSSAVAAIAAFYPPVLFHTGDDASTGSIPAAMLLGEAETAELAADASPINHVSPDFPPTFLLHGAADRLVPPASTALMFEALSEAEVPVEMHVYPGLGHAFVNLPTLLHELQAVTARFLERQVVEPERVQAEMDEVAARMAAMRQAAATPAS